MSIPSIEVTEEVVLTDVEMLEPVASNVVTISSHEQEPFIPTHTDTTQVTFENAIQTEPYEIIFTTTHLEPIESEYAHSSDVTSADIAADPPVATELSSTHQVKIGTDNTGEIVGPVKSVLTEVMSPAVEPSSAAYKSSSKCGRTLISVGSSLTADTLSVGPDGVTSLDQTGSSDVHQSLFKQAEISGTARSVAANEVGIESALAQADSSSYKYRLVPTDASQTDVTDISQADSSSLYTDVDAGTGDFHYKLVPSCIEEVQVETTDTSGSDVILDKTGVTTLGDTQDADVELVISLSSRSKLGASCSRFGQLKESQSDNQNTQSPVSSQEGPVPGTLGQDNEHISAGNLVLGVASNGVVMETIHDQPPQHNNEVVISRSDEATSTDEKTKSASSSKYLYLPSQPHSLFVVNKQICENSGQPEITIERKKVHECIVCKLQFKSITELFRHRVEHNESLKSSFKCSRCDQTFKEPIELEKHNLSHLEQKLYQCSICQDTFTLLHNYKCHLRIHSNNGPYVCNMCYRVFDKKAQFISHMEDHEFASVNPFRHRLQCNVCDKIFADSSKLKRHMISHSVNKEFKCDLCPKEFTERHKLARHMLTHSGRRDYPCPHCDRAFALKHNLTAHIRIHENVRPYQCFVCKKTFIQKIVLQRHLRIHQDYLIEQSHRFSQRLSNQ